MSAEEQELELESLAAIFDEKFTADSDKGGFTCDVFPFEDDDPEENHVGAKLVVRFGSAYPEGRPESLKIDSIRGLNQSSVAALMQAAETAMEENEGMASMYAVAEALKEWMQAHNHAELSLRDQMLKRDTGAAASGKKDRRKLRMRARSRRAEVERQERLEEEKKRLAELDRHAEEAELERRRAMGTPFSIEKYQVWRTKFIAERQALRDAEAKKEAAKAAEQKKDNLTGKEIFQLATQGLAEAAAEAAAAQEEQNADENDGDNAEPEIDEDLFDELDDFAAELDAELANI